MFLTSSIYFSEGSKLVITIVKIQITMIDFLIIPVHVVIVLGLTDGRCWEDSYSDETVSEFCPPHSIIGRSV